MSERSLALRILSYIGRSDEPLRIDRICKTFDMEKREAHEILEELERLKLVYRETKADQHGIYEDWILRKSDLFNFLNETPDEFTQRQMAQRLSRSRKWVSTTLRKLVDLGIVHMRKEALKRGGRRLWYRRG